MNVFEKVEAHFMNENGVSISDLALQRGVSEQVITDVIAEVNQRRLAYGQRPVSRKPKLWEHVNVKK